MRTLCPEADDIFAGQETCGTYKIVGCSVGVRPAAVLS